MIFSLQSDPPTTKEAHRQPVLPMEAAFDVPKFLLGRDGAIPVGIVALLRGGRLTSQQTGGLPVTRFIFRWLWAYTPVHGYRGRTVVLWARVVYGKRTGHHHR